MATQPELSLTVTDFLDTEVSSTYAAISDSHNFTSENYRMGDYNVQRLADDGEIELTVNNDGTYFYTRIMDQAGSVSEDFATERMNGITSWEAGETVTIYNGITPELEKANLLNMDIADYVAMLSYSETLQNLDESITELVGDNPSEMAESIKTSALVYMMSDGEVNTGLIAEDAMLTQIDEDLNGLTSFIIDNSSTMLDYHNFHSSPGDVLSGAAGGFMQQQWDTFHEEAPKVALSAMIGVGIEKVVEGGVLLAASEGYMSAEMANTLNELYSAYQTAGDISKIYDAAESGDLTALLDSELFNLENIDIDEGITDTLTSLNGLYEDIKSFEDGDIKDKLEVSKKYFNIDKSILTQDFVDEGGISFLSDLNTWVDSLGVEGYDFDLSGLDLDFGTTFDGDIEIDSEMINTYADLGINIGQFGIEFPSTDYTTGSDKTVAESTPEESTEREDIMLDGEVEVTLPQQKTMQSGASLEDEDSGFKQTDIFQAQTEGTTELGLQTPTVGVDPLRLDVPSFVNPYDPNETYNPLRSA